MLVYKDGEPCGHPGCCSHVTHPCEGCGRTQCQGNFEGNSIGFFAQGLETRLNLKTENFHAASIRCAGCGKWIKAVEEDIDTLCADCLQQISEQPQSFTEND